MNLFLIDQLLISLSIVGFGVACIFSPPIAMVSKYFRRRLAIANGISMSGGAVSAFIMPPLLVFLIDKFEFRGMIFILGGIFLNVAVGGALFRPVDTPKSNSSDPNSAPPNATRQMLLNPRLYTCGIPLSILTNVFPITYALIPPFAANLGISQNIITTMLLFMGIPDIFGRFGIGFIADKAWLTKWQLMAVLNGLTAVLWFSITLFPGMVGMYIFSLTMSMLGGSMLTLMAPVTVEAVGIENIHAGLGIVAFLKLINVPLPILLGWIRDRTGSWIWSYRTYSFILLTSNILLLANFFVEIMDRTRRNGRQSYLSSCSANADDRSEEVRNVLEAAE